MTELRQDRKSELPAEQLKLSPEWVDALTKFADLAEKMAFSDPYHLGIPYPSTGQLTQLTVLPLPPPYPHKEEEEEEEEVFIEKADFDEDILSAAAKMNCSGEEGIIKYVEETETDGCILAYRDADGKRKAGYI